ncbi:glycosyltransferase family 10 domain-containing protein [Hoeflea poritis]|uniref:Glycosyltransferase family 10 n=1 Tax=Hoeflea poritis TaxID=2993659 RepID=A0ABT4VS14_9HYPH|nr:glycosyltransferase family 10 [Hoeflea poritis]MDA4846877.1 glycosyltransferase family 10 [Hoeflea poritis]
MKIGILPYEHKLRGRLADVRLDQLKWPLGTSPVSGTVGDLERDDHLILYPRSRYFLDPRPGVTCRVSMLIAEPFAVHRRNYLAAIALQGRFHRIITHRPAMTRWTRNALVMPFGGAWVDPTNETGRDKSRHMSLIASAKRELEGHALRHEIADWCASGGWEVDLLGLAYRRIETKEEGLSPYRYSIVIENSREHGYFTEKLVDCLLCRTVPIYWGAPDIDRFFDTDGMLVCHSAEEIRSAIETATAEQYAARLPAIEANRERALAFTDYEKNAAQSLLKQTTR